MTRWRGLILAALACCWMSGTASAASDVLTPEHGAPEERAASDRLVRQAADGTTWVVWVWRSDAVERILSSRRPAGGRWTTPSEVVRRVRDADAFLDLRGFSLAAGTQPVITWVVGRERFEADVLQVAELDGEQWRSQELAKAGALPMRDAGSIAAAGDGSVHVGWIEQEQMGEATLGRRVWVAERTPQGTWRAPVLVAGVSGDAFAIWLAPVPGRGVLMIVSELLEASGDVRSTRVWVRWEPQTGWRVTAPERSQPLTSLFGDEVLGPRFVRDGRAAWLELYRGPYGFDGLGLRFQTIDGRPDGEAVKVPRPSRHQLRDGWLGSGYINPGGLLETRAGELVVGYGVDPADVEQGNFGMGSIWAATRRPNGRWRVDPIDPLAEMTGTRAVTLTAGADGRLVATWTVELRQGSSCTAAIMRATRMDDGRWTPRRLVRLLPRARSICADVAFVLEGRDPVLGYVDRGRLRVLPLGERSGAPEAALPLRPRLLTQRWSQVRRAGGFVVGCPSVASGACSVSLLRERRAASQRESARNRGTAGAATGQPSPTFRVVECLPYRVGAAVGPRASRVHLPWARDCAVGWSPPTVDLAFRVSLDVPGRRPAVTTLRVRIRR